MKPDWHWANKPEPERQKILQKVSKGWGKKPKTGEWLNCPICGKEFYRKRCHIKRSKTFYCSKKCFNKSKKGKIPPNIEQARKNSPIQKGSKNINWKGGKPTPYPDEWNGTLKHKIFKREKGKCQECGKRKNLVCHHVNFDKNNCSLNNLKLLCRSCHMKVHWKANKGIPGLKKFIEKQRQLGLGL